MKLQKVSLNFQIDYEKVKIGSRDIARANTPSLFRTHLRSSEHTFALPNTSSLFRKYSRLPSPLGFSQCERFTTFGTLLIFVTHFEKTILNRFLSMATSFRSVRTHLRSSENIVACRHSGSLRSARSLFSLLTSKKRYSIVFSRSPFRIHV